MSLSAGCPPQTELEEFLLGRLDESDSLAIEFHVTSCAECQAQMASLSAEDDLVFALRTRPRGSSTSESPPNDRSARLVDLLVPHFKRIATDVGETASGVGRQLDAATPLFQSDTAELNDAVADFQQIGPYEVRGVLGTGGMGQVLHGYDPVLNRSVAIKIIHSKLLAQAGMHERLVREAQSAAAVEHDNIVAIYAVESRGDIPCIVMPLLRGMTLKQRLEETVGPLPLAEVVRIGREAADGLSAAHARGLLHCDIKPANMWLEAPGGRVKILDFGLAMIHGTDVDNREGICGTPGYLAPEQACGLPLDPRTDIFGLGCVLYRMATGRAPFTGRHGTRALWTVLSSPPAPASQFNPELPAELSNLIDRMLAREPADRPGSIKAVSETIDEIDRQLARRFEPTGRRRWITSLIAVGTLGACGVWVAWMPLTNSTVVKATFVGDEPPVAVVLLHDGKSQPLTLGRQKTLELPPGSYTLRPAIARPDRNLVPDHFELADGVPRMLRVALVGEVAKHTGHSQPVTGVAVVPGSSPPQVVSVGLDRTLVVWDSLTATRFVDLPHAGRCVAVSPDGAEIATAGGNKQPPIELAINIWNRRELTPRRPPLEGHSRMVTALAYSPGGKQLASAAADGVFVWNLSTSQPSILPQTDAIPVYTLAFSADGRQLLAGNDAGQLLTWDLTRRSLSDTLDAGPAAVRSAAFVADRLISAGDDGVIRVWHAGALEREWLGHTSPVLAVAISPDAAQVLSGDAEGNIHVWSVPDNQTVQILRGHTAAVNALSYLPDGRQAVSGGADGAVRLWQLPFP